MKRTFTFTFYVFIGDFNTCIIFINPEFTYKCLILIDRKHSNQCKYSHNGNIFQTNFTKCTRFHLFNWSRRELCCNINLPIII